MPREPSAISLEKVTLNLVEGDKLILSAFYPETGWSPAARQIINTYCNALREIESQKVKPETLKIEIELPFLKESKNA